MPLSAGHVLSLGVCLALLPLPGLAQATPSHAPPNTALAKHIQGTLTRIDGNELLIAAKGGTTETYQLSPVVQIVHSRPGAISDLRAGQFVACINLYGQSARKVASECDIFPDTMHGFSKTPGVTTTPDPDEVSGMVTDVRDDPGARSGTGPHLLIQLSDNGSTTPMGVSAVTVVAILGRGDASYLKPGAKISGVALQAVDGTQVIQTLTVLSGARRLAGHH